MLKLKNKKLNGLIIFVVVLFVLFISFIMINSSMRCLYKALYPCKYSEYVEEYSEKYNVDKNLVYSVIRSESRFNPNAVSDIGAKGLMQITEETFNWAQTKMNDGNESYNQIFVPQINIKYGTFILSILTCEFEDEKTAVAAYHAGWGTVKGWLEKKEHSSDGVVIDNIPFSNTNAYVNQVLYGQKIYNKLY